MERVDRRTGESRRLRESLRSSRGLGNMIGRSPEMDKLYRILAKVAQSSHPVLILGESGVGKELVARSIHSNGPHADRPFVPIDCGSLVPTLMESELFGYVKGAFTGANRDKRRFAGLGPGRDGLSRRDRRAAARPAGQVAARLAGKRSPAGRRYASRRHQRPHSCRNQPRSSRHGGTRPLPQRSLLPSECGQSPHPPVARTQAGHPALGRTLSGADVARDRHTHTL